MIDSEILRATYDASGSRFAVFSRSAIQLYAEDGTFLQRIGKDSGVPLEFDYIRDIEFAGDNLIVLDAHDQARWSVIRVGGRVVVESTHTLQPGRFFWVSLDTVVVATIDLSPTAVGYPLHLVTVENGDVLQHFGSHTGQFDITEPYADQIRAAPGQDRRHVWVGKRNRLAFEEWSIDGALRRVVEGKPEWFPPVTEMPELGEEPPTRLRGFLFDRSDRLWILSWVAAPTWEEVAARSMRNLEGAIFDTADYFDSRLDVFDLDSQVYYGSYRWSSDQVNLVDRDGEVLVAIVERDDRSIPRAALYRVELRQSTSPLERTKR